MRYALVSLSKGQDNGGASGAGGLGCPRGLNVMQVEVELEIGGGGRALPANWVVGQDSLNLFEDESFKWTEGLLERTVVFHPPVSLGPLVHKTVDQLAFQCSF